MDLNEKKQDSILLETSIRVPYAACSRLNSETNAWLFLTLGCS